MRIVVIGNGKIGDIIIKELAKEGHDVVAIDKDEKKLKDVQNNLDVLCIAGNGVTSEVQLEAGVNEADLMIAVTADDELNLLSCLIAKNLGAKHTMARVRNPEYAKELPLIGGDMGLSKSINPEYAAAREIFSGLRFPGIKSVEEFAGGKLDLAELKLKKDSEVTAMSLMDLSRKYHVKALVCTVFRNGETIIPDGRFKPQKDDAISFVAEPLEAVKFMRLAGITEQIPKEIMIVGAGRVAFYLIQLLQKAKMHPILIDPDAMRCRYFAEQFPKALVIQGDGTNKDTLLEEGIESVDAFISLTGTDEVNALLSMYAESKRVPKVVTKISHINLENMLVSENVGSIISPKRLVADSVRSYVMALDNAGESKIETLYRIGDTSADALEFIVQTENPKLLNIPFKDLKLRKNLLISCLIRGSQVIIPGGYDSIQMGDHVIIVTLTGHKLTDLSGILEK